MATALKATGSQSDYEASELLPKGEYILIMTGVGDPRESEYTRDNGKPADDYAFFTFDAEDENGEHHTVDIAFTWTMWAQYDKEGNRTKASKTREMAEAFLDREIDDDESIDFETDIIDSGLKAKAVLIVQAGKKNPDKKFNAISSILAMPKRRRAATSE